MSKNIFIWLDRTVTPDRITHLALCKIDSNLVTYRDPDKCIDYITNLNEDENRIVLILTYIGTPTDSDCMLQISEQLSQIHSIYILCNLFLTKDKTLAAFNKVHGAYTELDSLCRQLKQLPYINCQRREEFRYTDFIISSLPPLADAISANSTLTASHSSLSTAKKTEKQEAEFMYGQVLCDILIDMDSSRADMIEFCRQQCGQSEAELNLIEELDNYYTASNAIFWYTRDTFLYRRLNRALREQDISVIYSLRQFIKDLHSQLELRYKSQQQSTSSQNQNDKTYRGQLMNTEEYDKKIRQNNGGFFSVIGFFSTTRDRELASVFAGNKKDCNTSENECVLFEIHIDKNIKRFSYADISDESQFGEGEKEILFTMGAVFRIKLLPDDHEGVRIVQLQLTHEQDEQLVKLKEVLKKVIGDTPYPLVRLLRLLRAMGKYKDVEHFSSLAMTDASIISHDDSMSDIQNILGMTYSHQKNFLEALKCFKKVLDIKLKQGSSTDPYLAPIYANIGVIYKDMGDFKNALENLQKALDMKLSAPTENGASIAATYVSIGSVYSDQKQFSAALDMYKKSLHIDSKILLPNDPSLAITMSNIGSACYGLQFYDEAIDWYQKALEIRKHALTSTHPFIADIYECLTLPHYQKGHFHEALDYWRKAKDIHLKNLPPDYRRIKRCEEWIEQLENQISTQQQNITDI